MASQGQEDSLLNAIRADRETAQGLRRVVNAADLLSGARALKADALFGLIKQWRAMDDDSDLDILSAIADAQYEMPVLQKVMPIALAAARSVSVEQYVQEGLRGARLGERLASARIQAIEQALRESALVL